MSEVLKYVDVPIISNSKCNDPDHYNGIIEDVMLCAGKEEGGEDACTVRIVLFVTSAVGSHEMFYCYLIEVAETPT